MNSITTLQSLLQERHAPLTRHRRCTLDVNVQRPIDNGRISRGCYETEDAQWAPGLQKAGLDILNTKSQHQNTATIVAVDTAKVLESRPGYAPASYFLPPRAPMFSNLLIMRHNSCASGTCPSWPFPSAYMFLLVQYRRQCLVRRSDSCHPNTQSLVRHHFYLPPLYLHYALRTRSTTSSRDKNEYGYALDDLSW
jgi:hypothetical protein